ncbi:MAG: hypothetical protein DCC88_03360 [Spirobacillus cienkowskii]|jgi:hypothetical protein|uniref:DUF2282 domain-containing protein n=1 Tax=Spirobacillus cienkowskii TaxID=495820 RepID=A0A369KQ29_9BACT|nr:MAG: hypothetical protein DCC88_03360 [Spirobacillus cienkowskii]
MKLTKITYFTIACASILSNSSFAGTCTMHVTREACTGMEKESYAKCGGKASCDETKKTGSAEACAKAALEACANVAARQKQTKSKKITADFDGKPVEGGKNFCEPNRSDFNKC